MFVYRRRYQSGITLNYHSMEAPLPFGNGCRVFVLLFQNLCLFREPSDVLNFSPSYLNSVPCVEQALISNLHQTCFLFQLRFFSRCSGTWGMVEIHMSDWLCVKRFLKLMETTPRLQGQLGQSPRTLNQAITRCIPGCHFLNPSFILSLIPV